MMETIKEVLIALLLLLPESPVQSFLEQYVNAGEFTFLNYLNWFIPFDIISDIMTKWLVCMLAYRLYVSVKQRFKKII